MATFLLVHGAWHGAWCWERLAPPLRAAGHQVHALDLPGHGDDPGRWWRATLGAYGRRVAEAAAALPERPLLVGHSLGGMVISQAAALAPERFGALVYLAAFVPLPGESLAGLGRGDAGSRVPAASALGLGRVRIRPERARETFYDRCTEADAAWATARLAPEPMRPLLQRLVAPRPDALPRACILCRDDRAISFEHQQRLAARVPMARTVAMDADHSPFLSAPDELAAHLGTLASLPA